MTWTGSLAALFALAFAAEAFAEDDTREPDVRGASLASVEETDSDGDGIPDAEDNCPEVPNADQADFDSDGHGDVCDNCLRDVNPIQFDCDDDHCGNLCDADYDNDGIVGWSDFGRVIIQFGIYPPPDDLCADHSEPHGGPIGYADFGFFVSHFGQRTGPSGTTPGTVACPIWEP